jgi:putative peptidoglycan lipid II flippase
VAQVLILVPYLRASGVVYRPRFDFRDTGLGHTLRLGIWTVLFVVVNQVAYTVVVRLASGGTASGSADGTGYSVYSSTFLIMMVPHSIITVSLATAVLPTLSRRAAAADLAGLGLSLGATLRTALVVIVPFAALLPVMAPALAQVLWGYGAAAATVENFVPSLAMFGPGLVFFTVHYLMLRGFYALEQTRQVFFIQCAVAVTNIVAAVVFVGRTDDAATSPALVAAYTASYVVGAATSYAVLRRTVGGLGTSVLLRFLARLVIAVAASTAGATLVRWALPPLSEDPELVPAALQILAMSVASVLVFLGAARLLRLTEVTSMLATLSQRLSRRTSTPRS